MVIGLAPDQPAAVAVALAVIQVHATLALAAAIAVDSPADKRAWTEVAGTKLSGGGAEP